MFSGKGGGSKGPRGVFKTQCFENTACLVWFSGEGGGVSEGHKGVFKRQYFENICLLSVFFFLERGVFKGPGAFSKHSVFESTASLFFLSFFLSLSLSLSSESLVHDLSLSLQSLSLSLSLSLFLCFRVSGWNFIRPMGVSKHSVLKTLLAECVSLDKGGFAKAQGRFQNTGFPASRACGSASKNAACLVCSSGKGVFQQAAPAAQPACVSTHGRSQNTVFFSEHCLLSVFLCGKRGAFQRHRGVFKTQCFFSKHCVLAYLRVWR